MKAVVFLYLTSLQGRQLAIYPHAPTASCSSSCPQSEYAEDIEVADQITLCSPAEDPTPTRQTSSKNDKRNRFAMAPEVEQKIINALKEPPISEIEHFFKSLILPLFQNLMS